MKFTEPNSGPFSPTLSANTVTAVEAYGNGAWSWRSSVRRILTPVVSGTVIMLIAATVMPVVFDTLTDVPDGTSQAAALVAALLLQPPLPVGNVDVGVGEGEAVGVGVGVSVGAGTSVGWAVAVARRVAIAAPAGIPTSYSTSISLAEVTGIAARSVDVVIGVIFLAVAFFPSSRPC